MSVHEMCISSSVRVTASILLRVNEINQEWKQMNEVGEVHKSQTVKHGR